MIILEPFESKEDIVRLINWVDSNRLNIIWASDMFTFPLDEKQLNDYLKSATQNGILMFKVINKENGNSETVGHAELDLKGKEIKISRLLISKENRGKGFGEQMMKALINYIENNLKYEDICLTVFTFNKPAITLYEKLGFKTIKIDKGYMTFEGDSWDRQKMKLKK